MTYLRFHWIFNVPLIFVLVMIGWRHAWSTGEFHAMGYVLLAAMVFTTPWDNQAARRGIWGFTKGKYSGLIGFIPLEEYLFFILQTLAVMLGIHALFRIRPDWHVPAGTIPNSMTWLCLIGSVPAWILIGLELRKWGRRTGRRHNYLIHLVWFLPILYTQWLLAPTLLGRHVGMLAIVTLAFGVYYTLADCVAVWAKLWFFDEKQISGVKLGGVLPWEEAAFFFLTSLLVAQSFLLLLPYYDR